MNFFGYISINAALAQMLGGLLIGMVAGLCAPSGYELAQPIEYRQKVWFWKKYHEFSFLYLFKHLIKIFIAIFLLTYINIYITRILNVAPMSKHSPHLYILGIFCAIGFLIFKFLRYMYFKRKLENILNKEDGKVR